MALPATAPRILCIGIPVRDLTFRVDSVPARGSKANASHLAEICGGNALNAAIAIARLGGRVSFAGPMGDAGETSSGFILERMAAEGIETTHIVRMPGLMTPVSAIMIDAAGERTLTIYRDPGLWSVKLPDAGELLGDYQALLVESRCGAFAAISALKHAGAASPSSSGSIAPCRCRTVCSRPPRTCCSRASRCRRPPGSPATATL